MTPGPGQYELPQEDQKGITISGKYVEKSPENLPGPGAYEKKSTLQEGPAFSIGEKHKEKISMTPGPGEYEIIDDHGHGISFSSSKRD